jgi:DNA-binding CsgD family transcriptional regulator
LSRFNLSQREREATVLLAQGLRAKEIAQHIGRSEKTVYAHLARVCMKTGCRDHHEVVCALLSFACHGLGLNLRRRAP